MPVKLTPPKRKRTDRVVALKQAMPSQIRAAEAEAAKRAARPPVTRRRPVKLLPKTVKLLAVPLKEEPSQPLRTTMIKAAPGGSDTDAEMARAIKQVGDRPILWRQFPYMADKFAEVTKAAVDFRLSELVAKIVRLEGEVAVLKSQLANGR
jgi:hypothetical protein